MSVSIKNEDGHSFDFILKFPHSRFESSWPGEEEPEALLDFIKNCRENKSVQYNFCMTNGERCMCFCSEQKEIRFSVSYHHHLCSFGVPVQTVLPLLEKLQVQVEAVTRESHSRLVNAQIE
jgi:hypothetical protein